MTPLCAFCADAPMARWSFDDDKARPICAGCDDGSCEDPELHSPGSSQCSNDGTRARLLEAIRRWPGLTFTELRQRLGIPGSGCHKARRDHGRRERTADERENDKYQAALRRLVNLERVVTRGMYPELTYWPNATAQEGRHEALVSAPPSTTPRC